MITETKNYLDAFRAKAEAKTRADIANLKEQEARSILGATKDALWTYREAFGSDVQIEGYFIPDLEEAVRVAQAEHRRLVDEYTNHIWAFDEVRGALSKAYKEASSSEAE
jgi:hypothetical protein